MHDRGPFHGTIVSRIGRLADLHLVFPPVVENLIVRTFPVSLDVNHVTVGLAFALRGRDWAIDVGVPVRFRFFLTFSSVFCKTKGFHMHVGFEVSSEVIASSPQTDPPCKRLAKCSSCPTWSSLRPNTPRAFPRPGSCPSSRVSACYRADYDTRDPGSRPR